MSSAPCHLTSSPRVHHAGRSFFGRNFIKEQEQLREPSLIESADTLNDLISFRSLRLTCILAASLAAGSVSGPGVFAATPVEVEVEVEVVDPALDIPTLASMRGLTPPDPSGTEGGRKVDLMGDFVLNRDAAIRLGKAK